MYKSQTQCRGAEDLSDFQVNVQKKNACESDMNELSFFFSHLVDAVVSARNHIFIQISSTLATAIPKLFTTLSVAFRINYK